MLVYMLRLGGLNKIRTWPFCYSLIEHYEKNKQKTTTVDALIRRHITRRLIWVCTVDPCFIKRTMGLCGLIKHVIIDSN